VQQLEVKEQEQEQEQEGSGNVSAEAEVRDSKVLGTVEGSPKVYQSFVGEKAKIDGRAVVVRSKVEDKAIVEGSARCVRCEIEGFAHIMGDADLRNVKITNGVWDSQKLKGNKGVYHFAYDQAVLDVLQSIKMPKDYGVGDAPVLAVVKFLESGQSMKGLTGPLNSKSLVKKIKRFVYKNLDKELPGISRGASALSQLSSEQFKILVRAAKEIAKSPKPKKPPAAPPPPQAAPPPDPAAPQPPPPPPPPPGNKAASLIKRAFQNDPEFLKYVEDMEFGYKNPATGTWSSNVRFVGLPFKLPKKHGDSQHSVYRQWKKSQQAAAEQATTARDQWVQKHRPEGLSAQSRLTPERFDELEKGDVLWMSHSPQFLLKVHQFQKRRNGKPVAVLHQYDGAGPTGQTRNLNRVSLRNPMVETHLVPDHLLGIPSSEMALKAVSKEPWFKKDVGDLLQLSEKDSPYQRGSRVALLGQEGTSLGGKLVEGQDGTTWLLVSVSDPSLELSAPTLWPLKGPKAEPLKALGGVKVLKKVENEVPIEEVVETVWEPSGKYRSRSELISDPQESVSPQTAFYLPDWLRALLVPHGMDEGARQRTEKRLHNMTVADATDLLKNLNLALESPQGYHMEGLKRSGYQPEKMGQMRNALKSSLSSLLGHQYTEPVLSLANKYDLELEDVDAVRHAAFQEDPDAAEGNSQEVVANSLDPEGRTRLLAMNPEDYGTLSSHILENQHPKLKKK
jgi:hypothetical protein